MKRCLKEYVIGGIQSTLDLHQKILNSEQNYRFLVSLSHDNEVAIAVVISEKII